MATKSDLIEAQNFSRRRLLTAFISGAPGGREIEPSKPLRAVIIAIALTIAVILAGVFYGVMQPGLPSDWRDNRLIIAKDTGARYVSSKSVLHPVVNSVSARLLIPSKDFEVITTTSARLAGIELGDPVGIVGAPDTLPAAERLINDGWTACVADDGGTRARIGGATASATRESVVVSSGGALYVVAGDTRFAVESTQADAVLRAAGIDTLDPVTVEPAWLDLFREGDDLEPIVITDAGTPLAGAAAGATPLAVGDVLHITGQAVGQRYLVLQDGTLGSLSPLAWQLYQLGTGRGADRVLEVAAADVADLATAKAPVGGADWPSDGFTTLSSDQRPCALLQHDARGLARTVLATTPTTNDATAGVTVTPGRGAIVLVGGRGAQATQLLTIVDATGTSFALPGADAETVARLGYTSEQVGRVDQSWMRLLATGPELSTALAGETPDPARAAGSGSGG
ncbi:type VII secretion protein EccB [Schumannella sp. 10F1B-5-1]|uniref:type VII secretion protein EccB n=1 Tax=Schumannella sp. 10F1B-5-1 TaxID=2590780 RepID=UPI00113028D7|nr:type VII secretion protein EccB [Schumannella sp. 10F1B-5-1]TPW76751.1 type VII secretion protein EccB [Schumannella sp. 10F1B-5-1]